jgi:branched-chain amino acid transport system ATP-binding protein
MGTSTQPILTINSLETWYGPVNAIKGVNLEVRAGDITAVLGANGAGKTTLLNTIAGVIDPAKGSVAFDGQAIQGREPDRVARSGLVLVPEGRQIFPFLSVRDNLMMGTFARRDSSPIQPDLDRVFSWFPRLKERQDQHGGLLSGGEQQMLAIGRALMAKPKMLLLDEPSLGLSPLLTQEIFKIIEKINGELGVSILVVEQNASIALATANQGYIMELGRIVAAGTTKELREKDDVKEFYLGGAGHDDQAGQQRQRWKRRKTWR